MTADGPAVSAIIIFKDEERFIDEAMESVFEQTFEDWELLLVDDGSTDRSAELARERARVHGPKVRYLEHPDHANLGMSASRNRGLSEAKGSRVAFLDADDVWLPDKLERQIRDMERHPEAAMAFGPLLRWRQWTGEPDATDHEDLMGVGWKKYGSHPFAGQLVQPPKMVRLILRDDYFIPGGGLIKRSVLDEVGGFENPFRGMFEDAVVMVKICLRHPVFVSPDVLYLYRMHPDSCTHQVAGPDAIDRSRRLYHEWLKAYLAEHGPSSPSLRLALARASVSNRHRHALQLWLLDRTRSAGRALVPRQVRDRLRDYWRRRTRPSVPGS